jgi:tellurite resistance protein TehA-like permease
VPLRYRKSNDTYKSNQFHLIKQMSISYFNLPLGIAGLAAAWKLATDTTNCGPAAGSVYHYCLLSPSSLWQLCAIIAAIMFGQFFVFYLFKIIEFPAKVTTEWNHPGTNSIIVHKRLALD